MTDTQQKILYSVGTVTILTFGVKSIGFLQQMLVADRFGTGPRIEAYFLSLAIPGLLASLIPVTLTGGVLPVFLALRRKEGEERATRFLGATLGSYLVGLLLVSTAVAAFAGPLVAALAGRTSSRDLIIHLSWAAAPLVVLGGLFSTLSAVLNARDRFFLTTAWQCAPSVAILLFLVAAPSLDVWAISAGMLLGMSAQLISIAFSVRRSLPSLTLRPGSTDVAFGEVRARIVPLFLSSTIVQLNPLVDQLMASTLPTGSLSALAYADRIIHVFQALLISSVSTVGLVAFSQQLAARDTSEVVNTIYSLLRTLAFVLLPLSAVTILTAKPLVATLFERGAFDAASTTAVSQALTFFSLGLFPMGASFLIPQVYVALGATRTLAMVSVAENLSNIALNLVLMQRFTHSGIAFSTSLVYTLGIVALAWLLPAKLPDLTWRPIVRPLLRIAGATAAMTVVCLLLRPLVDSLSNPLQLAVLASSGAVVYVTSARFLRVEELHSFLRLLRSRGHET